MGGRRIFQAVVGQGLRLRGSDRQIQADGRGGDQHQGEGRDPRVAHRPAAELLGRRRPPRLDRLVVEEPPQVFGHRLGGGVPLLRVLLDRLQDDRLQVAGDAGVQRSGPRRLLGLDPLGQLEPVAGLEGRPQRQQLVERQPQRVDVRPGVPSPRNRSGPCSGACPGCRRWRSARLPRPWPGRSRRSRRRRRCRAAGSTA